MGILNNESVLMTTWSRDVILAIEKWIESVSDNLKPLFVIVPCTVDQHSTVILAPCGSKKNWPEDRAFEDIRTKFIEFLGTFDYEDGSSPCSWVEVGYGEYGQKVLRGNNENCYTDSDYYTE